MTYKNRFLTKELKVDDLNELNATGLQSNQSYEDVSLVEHDLSNAKLTSLAWEHSLLDRIDLTGSTLQRLECDEVLFSGCILANANWSEARLDNIEFRQSQLTGINLAYAKLENVLFHRCKLDFSLFHEAQLSDCFFENCVLIDTDFQNAKLRNAIFRNCDMRNSRFVQCVVKNLDLRGSQIAGISLETESFRNMTVDPLQVADLAQLLGIDVQPIPDE